MIAGKAYEGPKADIWSVGVILFALVCGYLPFEDQNTSQLYKKILAGEYSIPKWVSKGEHGWYWNPGERRLSCLAFGSQMCEI